MPDCSVANINPRRRDFSGAPRRFVFGRVAEFKRSVLETMRQPLEEGHVTISRAAGTMTFVSIHAYCGYEPDARWKNGFGIPQLTREIQNYLGRISGPLLDRIDLHIEVPR